MILQGDQRTCDARVRVGGQGRVGPVMFPVGRCVRVTVGGNWSWHSASRLHPYAQMGEDSTFWQWSMINKYNGWRWCVQQVEVVANVYHEKKGSRRDGLAPRQNHD